ncbi:hypothetical protein [Streptomyces sp. NPDC020817]|uniref:hypothetical protein n=1 Tax=Streptomyces sp. NPDC020817 TaxID=3365095 RepID=UPI0037AA486F
MFDDTARGQVADRAVAHDRDGDDKRDRHHHDERQLEPHRDGVDQADDACGGHGEHGLDEQHHECDQARGVLVRRDAGERHERLARERVADRHHADRQVTEGRHPVSHPNHQPIFGEAGREAHRQEEPLSGTRAAN